MADNTALNVILTANFKKLESDLKQAGLVAEKAVADIEGKFAKATPNFAGLAVLGGAVAGAVSAIVAEISALPAKIIEANRAMAQLDDTARRVGLTTSQLQQTQFVGQQAGIGSAQTAKDMQSFSSAIAGAKEEGSKLGQLLADNNIKLTDGAGKLRSQNDLLAEASRLFQGAATEQNKIDIAKLLGLSTEWIAVLEKGPNAFRNGQAEAIATGNVISQELINKAKDFDEAWSRGFSNFATYAKTAAITAAAAMRQFAATANLINDPNLTGRAAQEQRDIANRTPGTFKGQRAANRADELDAQTEAQLDALRKETIKTLAVRMTEAAAAGTAGKKDPAFGELSKPKPTNVAALAPKSKAGGGGGLTDEEHNYNQVVRYIEQIEKTGRILEAERATLGLSNAERAKAIELARLGATPDAEQLAIITKQLDANEKNREAIEKTNLAIKGTRDAAQFAGEQLANAFDALLDGGKIEDAINGITKALMKAAIQAALLGQGPLAGLLGTAGGSATGGIGGLIGSFLPGRASGGPVQSGKSYIVGENGPEMVRFGKNGTVQPNAVLGGSGGSAPVNVTVNNTNGSQIQTTESRGPGGSRQIEIMIESAVAKSIASNGGIAQALQGRYGLNRSGGRR